MSPSDVFIGARHFFGYLVPGAMWTAGFMLVVRLRPDELTNPIRFAGFLIVSYIFGLAIHGHLYRIVAGWDDARARRRAAGDTELEALRRAAAGVVEARSAAQPEPAKRYLVSLSGFKLEEYCRRYVVAGSEQLAHEFNDYESSINFFIGAPPAFVMLLAGIAVYTTRVGALAQWQGWLLFLAAVGTAAWLILARLHRKRYEERKVWLKAFLALTMQEKHHGA